MKSVMLLFLLSFTYPVRWISLPSSQEPVYVVRGLAGEMWVGGGPSIESISCTGKIMTYQEGSDGNLWLTDTRHSQIGKFTPDHKLTIYKSPVVPVFITKGPDEAM